jgi:hypothetical protein
VAPVALTGVHDLRASEKHAERDRTGDPVNLQPVRGLEAPHGLLGPRPIAAVDRAWRVSGARQAALQ